jgi:REP-associated tyrosine transposase
MARRLRIAPAGGIFHLTMRGVDRKIVFRSATDHFAFLSILDQTVRCYEWSCRFYCLMGNHFHLLVETPKPTLSEGMQHLNGCYAQGFNRRHGRKGHLFEDRFGSVLIETDGHLLELLRYVALNPVRAGLCALPEEWRWSSFSATAGLEPAPRFLDVDPVIGLFGVDRRAAQQAFAAFVAEGM